MPKLKGKRESTALIDVLTQSDRYVSAVNKRTKRSPMANAILNYQFSLSPLVSTEAKKQARENAKKSGKKIAGKIVSNALKGL